MRAGPPLAVLRRMRRYAAASACALILLIGQPGRARAQSAGAESQEPEPPATRWYGWQIAAVDAPLVAIAALSTDGGGEGAIVAVAGLVVSGPIVHGVHGRGGRAVGSAALRLICPLMGALVGSSTGRGEHEPGDGHTHLEGAAYGALGGYAVALGIDMMMGVQEVEPERPPPAAPVVLVGASSATLGLAGSF